MNKFNNVVLDGVVYSFKPANANSYKIGHPILLAPSQDKPTTSPNVPAEPSHNISSCDRSLTNSSQDIATGPNNIATGPNNIATDPNNIATGPNNIATGPNNMLLNGNASFSSNTDGVGYSDESDDDVCVWDDALLPHPSSLLPHPLVTLPSSVLEGCTGGLPWSQRINALSGRRRARVLSADSACQCWIQVLDSPEVTPILVTIVTLIILLGPMS